MKVCWLTNYYSPYKLQLFEELSKHIELTAIMLGGSEGENRNDEWVLKEDHHFKVVLIDKNYYSTINKLAKENDVFIDSLYCTFYGLLGVNAFRKQNKKTVMYADGGIAIDRGPIVNKTLSILMNRHSVFFSTGPHCDKYYDFYGVRKELIYHYRFSSLTGNDVLRNKEIITKKEEYRKQLGIDNKFTIVSVGQPIKRKGFDILLNSYIETGLTDDINLYIVGGNPLKEVKTISNENNLVNVHYIGLLNSEELRKYYASADCFVLCTREDIWGLVIEEAMSYALPVITSDNCAAGIHFNSINNSVIVCGVNSTEEYANAINDVYKNEEKRKELSVLALNTISEYTIENSALDIINNLNNI